MNFIKQEDDYGCVCAAFAMVLDMAYSEVKQALGTHPRKGYTAPEFNSLLAQSCRVAVTLLPFSTVEGGDMIFFDRVNYSLLSLSRAVFFARRLTSNKPYLHAIAYDPVDKFICPRRGAVEILDYQVSEIIATPTIGNIQSWHLKTTLGKVSGTYSSNKTFNPKDFEKELREPFMRQSKR